MEEMMVRIDWFDNSEIIMRRHRAAVRGKIPDFSCTETLETKIQLFDYYAQLGVAASMYILTQNIGHLRWPKDWKQAFKERWYPEWLLKKYPIKYARIEISAIYPKAKLPDPIFKERRIREFMDSESD